MTPAGDVLRVGDGVFHPPLLGAEHDAVEVGVDDGRPQALELGDEPAERAESRVEMLQRIPEDTVRETANDPDTEESS